ncbi:hypothetical protein T265_01148 [Opisthorchis viverrini]|uniref:Uncharacterized protein n=1 Tax=Opisthorchis viverrini TaxID=6198 RepID=A0A075AAN8_OPIVI|nr:hypothetical protein T265_01148 [Opisthorchis viverrini]KER32860.1 hypothetical protein T265_01148 [Opisthorchis viverrini]
MATRHQSPQFLRLLQNKGASTVQKKRLCECRGTLSSIAQWIVEVRKPSHHGKVQSFRDGSIRYDVVNMYAESASDTGTGPSICVNTDASLPYNHDLIESLIVKKKIKVDGGGTWCWLNTIIPRCLHLQTFTQAI